MDVTDESSIISAKDEVAQILQLEGRGLDYLVNNAGVVCGSILSLKSELYIPSTVPTR